MTVRRLPKLASFLCPINCATVRSVVFVTAVRFMLDVAIVGGGPAGLTCAAAVVAAFGQKCNVKVVVRQSVS